MFGLPDAAGSLAAQSVTVSLPASANAMAMDLDGDMWIAGGGRITEYSVTKSGSSYVLNQKSQISHNYSSSGDILIRDGFLYLTAKQDQAGDLLLTFDLLDRSLYNVQFLENTPKAYGLFFNEAKQVNLAHDQTISLLFDGQLSTITNLGDQGFIGSVNGAALAMLLIGLGTSLKRKFRLWHSTTSSLWAPSRQLQDLSISSAQQPIHSI